MRIIRKIGGAFLTSVFTLGVSGCAEANGPEGNLTKDIRVQTLTFSWQGQSASHDLFCAPTKFPPLRRGSGGDPLGGGVSIKSEVRGKTSGMSPIPQWALIELGGEKLLLRQFCSGQWQGGDQLFGIQAAEQNTAFVYSHLDGVVGLVPTILSDLSLTKPRKLVSEDDVALRLSQQINALRPLSTLLRSYTKESLADPNLVSLVSILPNKTDRSFPSEPDIIRCDGALPKAGQIVGSDSAPLFTRSGQDFLDQSPRFANCSYVGKMDFRGIAFKDRPRSPYKENFLHLISEDGKEVFIETKTMTLSNPELFLHAYDHGSFRGKLERDPFLDSEFFTQFILEPLSAFEGEE